MFSRSLQNLTAGLCLLVTLLTGVVPRQGWVLCLEPGGGVALELASEASRCADCPDAAEDAFGASVPEATYPACPCIDIPIVLDGKQEKRQMAQLELPFPDLATSFPASVDPFEPVPDASLREPPDAPRPPQALALIRSVVLLV